MIERLHQILIKELIHVFRDKRARMALIIPPLLQVLIFGYAATYDVTRISTAILDQDHTQESREFLARFQASNRFQVSEVISDSSAIPALIDNRHVILVLQIHPGFAALLRKGETAKVQAVLDGSDSNTALITIGYINQVAARYVQEYQLERVGHMSPILAQSIPHIELEERPWYNPNLEARWFFVPGIIGTILLTTVMMLTAFAVVREREIGTLEQLMVTPIRPFELIIGKTLPFLLIGLADLIIIAVVGKFWFQVPFRGNVLVLLFGTALFLSSALGIGLLISTVCTTQQQAFSIGFFCVTPMIMLGGFGYPITSMPESLQILTHLDPLRFYLVVLRSTFLKGVGLSVLWPQMMAMAILGGSTLTLATLRFHKTLD